MKECSSCANQITYPSPGCKRELAKAVCRWEERFKAPPKEKKSGKKKAQNKKSANASR